MQMRQNECGQALRRGNTLTKVSRSKDRFDPMDRLIPRFCARDPPHISTTVDPVDHGRERAARFFLSSLPAEARYLRELAPHEPLHTPAQHIQKTARGTVVHPGENGQGTGCLVAMLRLKKLIFSHSCLHN
jgi:hypothetical protein